MGAEQVSFAAAMPRDAAPAVDIGVWGDTSGSTPIGNSILGEAATGIQGVLGSAPGVNAKYRGRLSRAKSHRSRSGVRPQCDLMPRAPPKTCDFGWTGMLQTDYATGRPW